MLPVPIWKVWDGTEMPIPTDPSTNRPLVGAVIDPNPLPKAPPPITDNLELGVVVPTPKLPLALMVMPEVADPAVVRAI